MIQSEDGKSRSASCELTIPANVSKEEIRSTVASSGLSDLAAQPGQLAADLGMGFRLLEPAKDVAGDSLGFAVVRQELREQFLVRQEVDQADVAARLEEFAHHQVEPADAIDHHRRLSPPEQFQRYRTGNRHT